MPLVLISIDDLKLRDQVRAALRIIPEFRCQLASRDQCLRAVESAKDLDAVIVDFQRNHDGVDPRLAEIRQRNKHLCILSVGDLPERSAYNRLKVDLDIFGFVPVPLDPFDFARRLYRMKEKLLLET